MLLKQAFTLLRSLPKLPTFLLPKHLPLCSGASDAELSRRPIWTEAQFSFLIDEFKNVHSFWKRTMELIALLEYWIYLGSISKIDGILNACLKIEGF